MQPVAPKIKDALHVYVRVGGIADACVSHLRVHSPHSGFKAAF